MTNTAKKQRTPILISPIGILRYPHLTKPDSRFSDQTPAYKVDLALDPTDAKVKALIDSLTKQLNEHVAAKKAELKEKGGKAAAAISKLTVKDIGEPLFDKDVEDTGLIVLKFKMNASYKDQKTNKVVHIEPGLFDSKKNKLSKELSIWTGSKGRVAFKVMPYLMESTKQLGLALKLSSVQITELVSGSGGGSPFDEVDGFEADTDQTDGGDFGRSEESTDDESGTTTAVEETPEENNEF